MMTQKTDMVGYCGVLLAAGKGTRMAAFSDRYPKPILPIGNKPILVHQIELLCELGITDIVILIGYKGFQITRVLGDGSRFGVRLHYVEQTQMLGIAHALGQLEGYLDKPFLMFLGDIFFVPRDIKGMFRLFEEKGCGAVLATKKEKDPSAIRRNFSVVLNDEGRVMRVIEKPRHVMNNLKGVGLYLFDLSVFDAIRRTPRTALRDEYEITEAIQVLIDDGAEVRTWEAVEDDINVTYPEDLLKVNLQLLADTSLEALVDPTASIHPDAVVQGSVIGANVRIAAGVTVSNSVIFDDVTLDEPAVFRHSLVTPHKVVRCPMEEGEDLVV